MTEADRIALLERQLRRTRAALAEAESLLESRGRELDRRNRDLAERQQELLDRLDADNRLLLDAQRVGRFATLRQTRDGDGIASATLSDILGYDPGARFHLASLASRVHPLDWRRFTTFVTNVTGDGAPSGSFDLSHRLYGEGPTPRWLRWQLQRSAGPDGRFEALSGLVQDITEPRQAGRRVQALQLLDRRRDRRMLLLARDVETAQRARTAFLALMSHDVRTPMTGLLGMLSLLGASDLSPEQRRQIGLAQRGAEQLRLLLDEIIKLAEGDSGRLTLESAPVRVAPTVTAIVDFWRGARPDAADRITLAVHPDVPDWVSIDPTRFRQLLDNLISEALERSGEPVSVAVRFRPGRLVVDVGHGTSVPGNAGGGPDLAIAVCRRIVEAMGGRLTQRSGKGDTGIAIDLPVTIVEQPTAGTEADRARGRVLVVDDVDTNRLVVTGMLELHGLATAEAADGLEAVRMASSEDYAAIIMDIAMPALDGLEATRRIRELPGRRGRVPIIGLTAHAGVREREAALAAGMNICLSRPVDRQTLTLVVDRHLGRAAAPAVPLVSEAAFRDIFDRFDPAAKATLFGHFEADLADQMGRLQAAVAGGDRAAERRAVHALTGIAGTFGLEALRQALPESDAAIDAEGMAKLAGLADGALAQARRLLGMAD